MVYLLGESWFDVLDIWKDSTPYARQTSEMFLEKEMEKEIGDDPKLFGVLVFDHEWVSMNPELYQKIREHVAEIERLLRRQ